LEIVEPSLASLRTKDTPSKGFSYYIDCAASRWCDCKAAQHAADRSMPGGEKFPE
jgi:hypothetical protein